MEIKLLFDLLGSLPDLTFPHYFSMAKNGSEERVILNETEMIQNNHVTPNQKILHYSKLVFRIRITTSNHHLNEKIAPSIDTCTIQEYGRTRSKLQESTNHIKAHVILTKVIKMAISQPDFLSLLHLFR